jgi:hypothetical protein
MDSDRDRMSAMYAAYRMIMAAARRGTISPQGAIKWAWWAASGQDVGALDQMTGPLPEDRRQWQVQAARSDLAQRVLDILLQLVDQAGSAAAEPGMEDYHAVFVQPGIATGPGHYPLNAPGLVYDPADKRGNRRLRPGTGQGSLNPVVPYASARSAATPGEMSDEEADLLLPPRTAEEAERRARVVEARAQVEDLPDADYDRVFLEEYRRRFPGGGPG